MLLKIAEKRYHETSQLYKCVITPLGAAGHQWSAAPEGQEEKTKPKL